MIAYKGFENGLICRGYQFKMGLNTTPEANCARNGFHCAEDPLDCLTYYSNMDSSVYCIVNAGGDVNEDDRDSKISCTELTIIKQLTHKEFFLHALAYMDAHPKRKWNAHVHQDRCAEQHRKFAIVRGKDPIACGAKGCILAFAKEDDNGNIIQTAIAEVDGVTVKANTWYGADLTERKGAAA